MTTIFYDSFDGTGTLQGRVPDLVGALGVADWGGGNFSSGAWALSGDLVMSGGHISPSLPFSSTAQISESQSIEAPPSTTYPAVTLTTTFVTGADISTFPLLTEEPDPPYEAAIPGMSVDVGVGGVFVGVIVFREPGAPWTISALGQTMTFVGVAPSTTYSVEIQAVDGAQSVTVGGNTLTSADVFPVTGGGLSALSITVGASHQLGPITIAADAVEIPGFASVAATAPSPTAKGYGGATLTKTAPRPTLVSSAKLLLVNSMNAPSPSLRAYGGANGSLMPPSPTLDASARDSSGELAADLTAPSPTLSAYAGASASALTAPKQTLTAAGVVTIAAQAALSAPTPTLSATGTVAGVVGAAFKAPSPNLVGYGGAVCSITLTGRATLRATATTAGVASAALSCPLFQLSAGATAQNHGSANLLAPSPRMGQTAQAWLVAPGAQLTAIGSAVITATYEAYAVNLKHTARPGTEPVDETTRYTNFPFTHVIRHKGSYYGANSTGLYLLEGTTDDTAPITWTVKTAMTDFKSPQRKTVASAYFGGRLGPADTITLHAGEGAQTQPYSYTTPRGALAQNYRQAFGKGIKQHRYYALAASGTGEMALDNIDLDVHNLTRRI